MITENLIGSVNKGNEVFYIAEYFKNNNNSSILYIGRNDKEIFDIKNKLEWLIPSVEILIYRSWDQIPYDSVSPSKEIQSERIKTLYRILNNRNKKIIIITSVNAILQKTVDIEFLKRNIVEISINLEINFDQLIKQLVFLGYQRTSVVREKSEFAIRGSIIDVFLIDFINPIRLDFFDQQIESISEFDKITQKTNKKIYKKILINPSSELLLNKNSLNLFRQSFRNIFPNYRHSQIYNLFSESIIPAGGENFLPLFLKSTSTIFFYCSDYHIILNSDFENLFETRIENLNDFYTAREETGDKFHLSPKYLYLNDKELKNKLKNFSISKLYEYKLDNYDNFEIKKISNFSSIKKEVDFKFINHFFNINKKKHIIICTRSKGSLLRIKKILFDQLELDLFIINDLNELNKNEGMYITVLQIEEAVHYKNFIFLNEKSIFGYNFSTHQKKSKNKGSFF